MPDHRYSKNLSVQITPKMQDQLEEVAQYEEMTLSELTRWAIRERLRTYPFLQEDTRRK